MKKILALLLVALMLVTSVAFADESWVCPNCGQENTRNFCGHCGTEKPSTVSTSLKVGDTVTFGHYPQTASGTDNTPIEWEVFDVNADGSYTLLSKYALDVQSFDTYENMEAVEEQNLDCTWENSTLRRWLNEDFYWDAFSDEEQACFEVAEVSNSDHDNNLYLYEGTVGGNDTQDYVYLLSVSEVCEHYGTRMFDVDSDCRKNLICFPTEYALSRLPEDSCIYWLDVYALDDADWEKLTGFEKVEGGCIWMLRSPGYGQNCPADVEGYGCISYITLNKVDEAFVRPVIRVRIA